MSNTRNPINKHSGKGLAPFVRNCIDPTLLGICIAYIVAYTFDRNAVPLALSWTLVVACTVRYSLLGYLQTLELGLNVAIVYLIVVPCLVLLPRANDDYVIFLAVSVLIVEAFFALSRRLLPFKPLNRFIKNNGGFDDVIWVVLIAAAAVGSRLLPGASAGTAAAQFGFITPYAISLVIFERMVAFSSDRKVYVCLGIYVVVVFAYIINYWSGFGRLAIGAYLMAPFFVANSVRDIRVRVWQAVAVSPAAIVIAYLSRHKGGRLSNVTKDSGTSHLDISLEMLVTLPRRASAGWDDFFGQWSLLFFQWVPRAWWPNKPVGVGSSFVDQWKGREGFADGYSVATGYIGEQLWLLGSYAWIGIAIYMATLLILRVVIVKTAFGHVAPVAVFDAFLSTYIWGGGASFGARVWFFVIPMLLAIVVVRRRAMWKLRRQVPAPRRSTYPVQGVRR
jgi:hypothetical protein